MSKAGGKLQRSASYEYFPNALTMLYDELYITINCFDCNLPHCCMKMMEEGEIALGNQIFPCRWFAGVLL